MNKINHDLIQRKEVRTIANVKSRYYTVKDIQILEHCGRGKAYDLAKELLHETRDKNQIFVFSEAYDEYYENKKRQAEYKSVKKVSNGNIYAMKRLSERR